MCYCVLLLRIGDTVAIIHVRLDDGLKARADEALASMGLGISDAVRMFLVRVVADKELPFTPKATDSKTRAAMESGPSARSSKNKRRPTSHAAKVLDAEGSVAHRAELAWRKFSEAASSQSHYLSIVFDDPFIHATVKHMGGWAKLTPEMIDPVDFQNSYRLFVEHGLPSDTPLRLPGVVEGHRILNGLAYEEPIQLVGDKALAEQVAKGWHPAMATLKRVTDSETPSSAVDDLFGIQSTVSDP